MSSSETAAVANKLPRGLKATLLLCIAVVAGFLARFAIDALMREFPGHSDKIDVAGQFMIALGIVWFCLVPVLEDYGLIKRTQKR